MKRRVGIYLRVSTDGQTTENQRRELEAAYQHDRGVVRGPTWSQPPAPRAQTQGKIERWHQTLKNHILLDNYYLPGDLERQISAFVEHYNHVRYHESLSNLTPADVYFGRADTILANQACNHRPTRAASVAGRLNSNPEEPEPPFTKRLTSLKSSDDGQSQTLRKIFTGQSSDDHSIPVNRINIFAKLSCLFRV